MEYEKEAVKEVVSFRIDPLIKFNMTIVARQNGFKNLSEYLVALYKRNTGVIERRNLNEVDVAALSDSIREELRNDRRLTLSDYNNYLRFNKMIERVRDSLNERKRFMVVLGHQKEVTSEEALNAVMKYIDDGLVNGRLKSI